MNLLQMSFHSLTFLLFSIISSSSSLFNSSFIYNDDLYFSEGKEGPQITKHSHFSQKFRLGFKLLLSCESIGYPRPSIIWYKNGAEITPYKTIHIRERHLSSNTIRSSLDIDPTTIADKGIYGCLSSNSNGFHLKSMRAVYTY